MAAAAVAVTAAMLASAGAAAAHVKVSGTDTTQGGFGVLTFRVPTESATASTTGLLVTLPADHPIISVTAQDKPGWIVTVTHKTLATPQKDDDGNEVSDYIASVEWKAAPGNRGIAPSLFDTFSIAAGPLPKASSITLPTAQTYSDGTVVNWNETTSAGGAAPEHPAPVLTLTAAGNDATHPTATAPPAGGAAPSWLPITALVVALVAVLLGVANLAVARRKG
ncbi:YcnI family protein [Mycobacterium sp. CBMA226]|nr:YcnI family protein [Mycolicibacterium sp. CBMA 226]